MAHQRVALTTLRVAITIFGFLLVGACQEREIKHPTEENVVPDHRISGRIRVTPGPPGDLSSVATRLRAMRQVASIDLSDAKAKAAGLGRVDDLWVGPDGEMFVVDAKARLVGIVENNGGIRGAVDGRRSSDIDDVERLLGVASGRLLLTGRSHSAAVFMPTERGYEYVSRVSLNGRPDDICSFGDEVYARIVTAGTLFTRVTIDGRGTRTFGEPYRIADGKLRYILSQGRLACAHGADVMVAMFTAFPEVYGFTRDGRVRWISRFEDFKRPRLIEVSHPGHVMLLHAQRDVADRLERLVDFESKYVIVQLMRFSPDTRNRPHEYHSYVLDATTGSGEYISATLPLLRASRGTMLYAEVTKPSLRLAVYSIDPR